MQRINLFYFDHNQSGHYATLILAMKGKNWSFFFFICG